MLIFTALKNKSFVLPILCFILFLGVLGTIQYHYIATLWNPAWGDMVSMPLNPIPFKNFFLLWNDQYVGTFGTVNIPHFILSQFTRIISPHYLQIIYMNLPVMICFWGIYDILGRFNIKSIRLKSFATLLFSLYIIFSNVFIVNYAQGQFETTIVYYLAILIFFYLYFAFRDQNIKDILTIFILLQITIWYNWLATFYTGIFLLPEFFALSFFYFYKRKVSIKRYIIGLILLILLIVLANANVIYQLYFNLFSAVQYATSGSEGLDIIKNEINFMYGNSTILNAIYNVGNLGDMSWIYFDYQSRYLNINYVLYTILVPFNFLFLVYLLMRVYENTKLKHFRLIDILLYVCLLYLFAILLFMYLGYLKKIDFIIDNLPFVSIYRNPKKLILSSFALSVIMYLLFFIKDRNKKKYILILLFLVIANFIAKFQFLTSGYMGKDLNFYAHANPTNTLANTFTGESSYPTYYYELSDFLKEHNFSNTERIIVLPNNSQTLYESFLRYSFPIFHVSANAEILGGADISNSLIYILYERIINIDNINNLLKIGNVRYIVVDKKSPYYLWDYTDSMRIRSFGSVWFWGRPEIISSRLSDNSSLQKVYESDSFYIYEFNNHTDSLVYIPSSVNFDSELIDKSQVDSETDLYLNSQVTDIIKNSNYNVKIDSINKDSPTKYKFNIVAMSDVKSLPIFFSQKFNSNWELTIHDQNGKEVQPFQHSVGNSFGNAWFIDINAPGTYSAVLNLSIQKNNTLLTWISLITVIIIFAIRFVYIFIYRK